MPDPSPVGSGACRRIGVMGGTFDPVHNGHLCAASEAAAQFGLDEVVFVPTGRPWQKADAPITDAEDRYAMTVLATSGHPRFRVSRMEIDRDGDTYTVDTLRQLRRDHGDHSELFFITGADTIANAPTWRAVDEVFRLARFVAVNRPGYRVADVRLPEHARVTFVTMPDLEISSSDCRARVAAGRPIWFLTPEPVVRYILARGLYRPGSVPTPRGGA